uniref:Uncharacterized protein n=1 Tax=Lotus japonicus TaxID=34305 RepID=I3S276_LOTJA|nr:unknown [Lotus japonicus]
MFSVYEANGVLVKLCSLQINFEIFAIIIRYNHICVFQY